MSPHSPSPLTQTSISRYNNYGMEEPETPRLSPPENHPASSSPSEASDAQICPRCGSIMFSWMCEDICPNCGFRYVCSDL
jgi:hypothetical protein